MDILYILGRGSKWGNAEIRYSLRSLEKYGHNINKIYVCGYDPEFFSNKVTVIPCDDPFQCAHKNIAYKIGYAIEHSDIGEEFLLSSDDHFLVKDTDFDNFPYYYKGELNKSYSNKSSYWTSLADTYRLLSNNGYTTFLCNPHCNTHISRAAWEGTKDIRKKAMELPYGGEINCILGNWFNKNGKELTYYRDVKVRTFSGKYNLLNQIGENHCFSIYDQAIQDGIGKYLSQLFPNACKYEKDGIEEIGKVVNIDNKIIENGVRIETRNGVTYYYKTK